MTTYSYELDVQGDPGREVVTLWQFWEMPCCHGISRPWSWEHPPSVAEAIREGRKQCRAIYGVEAAKSLIVRR